MNRTEAIETLRERLPRGATAYTVLRHVARSGMQRGISVHARPGEDDLSYLAAIATGRKQHPNGGVKCNGGGMDMAFELVWSLSSVLYDGDGYALNYRNV